MKKILATLVTNAILIHALGNLEDQQLQNDTIGPGIHEIKLNTHLLIPVSMRDLESKHVLYPDMALVKPSSKLQPPFIRRAFIGFKEALAFKESGGSYFAVNTSGYLGKYQFGIKTLNLFGVNNPESFLADPQLQEKVFLALLSRNKWLLRKEIIFFSSQKIKGMKVTESGILAAAHLAGAGNVKKYLFTRGEFDPGDVYGTKVSSYMTMFAGYDLSAVTARRHARIQY